SQPSGVAPPPGSNLRPQPAQTEARLSAVQSLQGLAPQQGMTPALDRSGNANRQASDNLKSEAQERAQIQATDSAVQTERNDITARITPPPGPNPMISEP
ncbi:MAG: hypothetical protein ACREAB_15160, partial [Blastocatellia bacterium]